MRRRKTDLGIRRRVAIVRRHVSAMSTPPAPALSAFMLLFRNAGPEAHAHLDEAGRARLTQQWNDWYDGLAARGQVEHGRPLGPEGRVVSGPGGTRVVDGPFAETH